MAHLKAGEVDRYLAAKDQPHKVVLIYGPDIGLVSERAAGLAARTGSDIDDPFSTIRLDADDAASDPARIADEAHTVSMFSGDRLIWVRGSTQKNLAKAIEPVLRTPPQDAVVLIEAGDLKRSSPLRKMVEASPCGMALPCYQDQERAIDGVIDDEMRNNGLTIAKPARIFLKSLLGSDRLASRGEVQKLCLYVGEGEITEEDVAAIVGDAASVDMDRLIDAASTGDIQAMETAFKRLASRGTAMFQIVAAAQRHFHMLHRTRANMETKKNVSVQSAVASLRPPVSFRRRDSITRALQLWHPAALLRSLERLDNVALESRMKTGLAVPLVSTALLAIAIEAKRAARN